MKQENLDSILIKIEKHLSSTDRLIRVLENLDKKFSYQTKSIQEQTRSINEYTISTKKSKREIEDFGDITKKTSINIKSFSDILKQGIPHFKDFFKNSFFISKNILSFDNNLGRIGTSLKYVGGYGSKLNTFFSILGSSIELLSDYIDVVKTVSRSTVNFEDGLSGIIIAASKAGMSLENYAKFLEEYSGAVNRYGLPSTLRMIEGLRNNAKELYMMGLSVSEVNNYFGEFLEQQRLFDGRRIRNETELQNMFVNQMKMTYEIAESTGRSFSEVFRSINDRFKDPRSMAALQTLPEQIRNQFVRFIEIFPSLSNLFMTGVQKGAIQFSDEYANYASSILPELNTIFEGLMSGTISARDGTRILINTIDSLTDEQKRLFALQGDNVYGAVSQLIYEVNRINKTFDRTFDERKTDNITKSLLGVESALIDFQSQVRTRLLAMLIGDTTPENVADIFEKGKEKISSAMGNILSGLDKLTKTLTGESGKTGLENLILLLEKIMIYIGDALSWLGDPKNFKLIKDFVSGIAAIIRYVAEFAQENPVLSALGLSMLFRPTRRLGGRILEEAFDIGSWGFDKIRRSAKRGYRRITGRDRKPTVEEKKSIIPETGGDLKDSDIEKSKSKASKISKLTKGISKLGKFSIPGLLFSLGTEAATEALPEGETKENVSSILSGAGTGSLLGSIVGSLIPGIGTAIGAIAGGALGSIISSVPIAVEKFQKNIEEINKPIQDLTLPPTASLEKTNDELKSIRESIQNVEKQFAEMNRYAKEGNYISSAILRENKESNEKITSITNMSFMDNVA